MAILVAVHRESATVRTTGLARIRCVQLPCLQAAAALAELFMEVVLVVAEVNTTIKCIGVLNHLFQR
jgi:hypothetical protein